MTSEKQLKQIWKKYVDKPIYRVVPKRDLKNILKNGINTGKEPYKKIKPKLRKLSKIINRLEKKGFVMMFNWGSIRVSGNYAIKTTLLDMNEGYIDFSLNKKSTKFYLKLKGGALVSSINEITKKMLEKKLPLKKDELKLVKSWNKWAKKMICDNVVIYIRGSSKIFENAFIMILDEKKLRKIRGKRRHIKSFFGSFEYFKKYIGKRGLGKYTSLLKKQNFYLRVRNKIPAMEIVKLR